MKCSHVRTFVALLWLTLSSILMAAPPDLTAPGVIASINRTYTYNLGPTGLRGWIYYYPAGGSYGADGTITVESRQILVTVASTPASAVLAVDDVILGAMAADSGEVPLFTTDARKAFGVAIGEAEKSGAGTLRVKCWRAGVTNDVNFPMTVMGDYTATAPYSCPKSSLILTNALNKFVGQLLADSNFLNSGNYFARSIHALALLAGVTPSHPNYAAVQTRLQTYARALATIDPATTGSLSSWGNSYGCLFLSEYYLSTGDTNVLSGIGKISVALANAQSMYGTYGHDPALGRAGSSGRHNIGYGPVNQVGIIADMAMVMATKALEAGGRSVDPVVAPAIQRSNDYFAWYVNKGHIPYGEHDPALDSRESNGKEGSCAVLFSLQNGRAAETEYFARMAIAGFNSRECGHTGQGFSYLWGALGANVGGSLATAEYLKNVRWHLDLSRRTDGSFVYDGQEAYGPGTTADGTYLGASSYSDLKATASYILTYSLPLQRLYITGKNAIPGNTLDSTKVAHAIASDAFKQNSPSLTIAELITALTDFDPIVRHQAATELGKRSLSAGELSTLRDMVTDANVNARMGACQALGLLKDDTALPMLVQRLDKTSESNSWVRAKAANAIRYYATAKSSVHLNTLLATFVANATDPDDIDWDDPLQSSNGHLAFALFGDDVYGWMINNGASLAAYTVNASTNLLYPALRTGLKHPESKARLGPAKFAFDRLSLSHVQALITDFIDLAKYECQADRMWGSYVRGVGIQILGKYKITEGVEVALSMLEVPAGFTHSAADYIIPALNVMEAYGDAAHWTLPKLRYYRDTWDPNDNSYPMQVYPDLLDTLGIIENAITAPAQSLGLAVASSQVVSTATGTPLVITLAGTSPRRTVHFMNVTAPTHGTLTGTAPKLTYTPASGYTGVDHFTFQVTDGLTTSETGTVSIIVGTPGTGIKGEYYDNADFTNLRLTRTDAQINFDWGTGSPDASLGADTFSVRWTGLLLVPETGNYSFTMLNDDCARLYVNGVVVIDNFAIQPVKWIDSASVALTEGQLVEIQMDYFKTTGTAIAKLKWTGPSFAGVNGAVIGSPWLYDGTGMTRTPFAFPQSVTLVQNTSQAVTLMGSHDALTYAVVTPPAHGSLSGTAPNLTYTPSNNYNGLDSFTFLVNNGTTNSAPATVSIGILASSPENYTWLNAGSGNWSVGSNWTSNSAPAAAGDPSYNLDFTPSGTYTVTNDLNNGFKLNQLNVAGAVTLAGTQSMAFTANGSQLPQCNQTSASEVTINTPVSLAAMTTFGGSGSGQVNLSGVISGTGGLTKDGSGTLKVYGYPANNTFTGGTIINQGTLHWGTIDGTSPLINGALGSGSVTVNASGTLEFDRVDGATNALVLNGGRVHTPNGWGAKWNGPVTLNADSTVDGPFDMTFRGVISGSGGFIKQGTMTLYLSATNSYTGPNRVNTGTLSCSKSEALGSGPLYINAGAKVALNYTGSRNIASLTLGGTAMPAGTYGSTASTAANKNDIYFSGTGILDASAVNSAPVANAQAVTTPVDTAKDITLTGSDADGNPLTCTIVTQPANGTLTGTAPNVNYTPVTNFTGIDSFTFKVNDGTVDSAVAMVSIAVTALNTPPVVNAGTNQIVYLAMPFAAGWSFAPWTGDADSGISTSCVYTARHCFGNNTNTVAVNGVSFPEANTNSGTGWSIGGGGSITPWDGNDTADISGNSELLAQEFVYNGNPRTVTFTNLTVGQVYEASFYSVAWEDGNRIQTFSTPGVTSTNINQDHYGNNQGIRISCTYTATVASQTLTIMPFGGGTFHLYAIANRVFPPTASVNLSGSASDADEDPLMTMWSVVSPTNATMPFFVNAAMTNTTATFSSTGSYVLGLTADDSYTQALSLVTITVRSSSAVTTNHTVPLMWLDDVATNVITDYEAAVLADPDGDGFSTWEEYWSGTDPYDNQSFLCIDSITFEGGSFVIKWESAEVGAGVPPLAIMARTNMLSGSWTNAGQATLANGINVWSNSAAQQLYYRLAVTNVP